MKTVIKNFFKEKERELVAKVLLFMVVPFIVIGCGGTVADTNNPQVNSAPTISTIFADIELLENSGTANYELNISDADGDALTLSVESNDTSIITVTQNWNNSLLLADYQNQILDFNLTTVTDAFGTVKITINLSDGGENNATTSFDVNVTEVITHNGITYATVTSPYTGKVWLDRNLGASQVCTAFDDAACYGDYYQWGRETDGHQISTSSTTGTLETDLDTSSNNSFITNSISPSDWTSADSDGALRTANWSKIDGTSVCPVGYRVPTIAELAAETTLANTNGSSTQVTNSDTAFSNFLKLPTAGNRSSSGGSMSNLGSSGHVWSSSVSSSFSVRLLFHSSAETNNYYRADGLSVRCLKD